MRILFVANGISGDRPGLAGGETRFIEIAKAWEKSGHSIHLMSSLGGKKLCSFLGLSVVLHRFVDYRVKGRLQFILKTIKAFLYLPESLKGFDSGMVYSTNEMLLDIFPALRLKLKYGKAIKWAVVVHWLPPFPPWKRRKSTIMNAILFFLNERMSVWLANWFADMLLPVSPMTMEQLRRAGARMEKVRWVECGVNYREIRTVARRIETKKYDAVYMKRLQAVKGIFDLIAIWEEVVKARPDARLLVIGEGVDGEKARGIVRAKSLDKNIEFAGMIYDFKDKFKKIAAAKLFVLPTYEENWAIVVGEAMAAGTPVISYDLKEMVDVWGNAAVWISTGDRAAFARAILDLLDQPTALADLSRRGVGYVRRYDWKDIAERELSVIRGQG